MVLNTLKLPDNFIWVNEFDWSPVAQSSERSLTGALIVSESSKSYGRSIVLGDGENSWLMLADVNALYALSEQTGHRMSLTLSDGRTFTVIFDRTDGPAIEAQPLFPSATPAIEHLYTVVIRLLTISTN